MHHHFVVACFLSILTLSLTTLPKTVLAEDTPPPDDDVVSVYDRDRDQYKAKGIPVGAFILRPTIDVLTYSSSNIFAQENNEESDIVYVVKPGVSLASNWYSHGIKLHANTNVGRYSSNSDENYVDYILGAAGRLDVRRGIYVFTNAKHQHRHEERGSPDDVNGTKPTEYDENVALIGVTRDVGRVALNFSAEAKQLDYDDARTNAGIVINNDDRDRKEFKYNAKASYEFIPNYKAFTRFTYDVRSYDEQATVSRDSKGYNIVAGTSVHLTGKVKGDVYAGYLRQNYDAAQLNSINNFDLGSAMLWNVTDLTSLRFGLKRSVQETTENLSSGYVTTGATITAEHELRRNILLGANLSYSNNNYTGSAGSTERDDDLYKTGLELGYFLPRPGLSVQTKYNYTERDSNIVNNDYTDNRFSVKLHMAF